MKFEIGDQVLIVNNNILKEFDSKWMEIDIPNTLPLLNSGEYVGRYGYIVNIGVHTWEYSELYLVDIGEGFILVFENSLHLSNYNNKEIEKSKY